MGLNQIRYSPEYTIEQWAEMVYEHELAQARADIAAGAEADSVLEQMSKRIRDKMIVPHINRVKKESEFKFDAEANRRSYEAAMRGEKNKDNL
jgi:glutamyl-tRNA reductase